MGGHFLRNVKSMFPVHSDPGTSTYCSKCVDLINIESVYMESLHGGWGNVPAEHAQCGKRILVKLARPVAKGLVAKARGVRVREIKAT